MVMDTVRALIMLHPRRIIATVGVHRFDSRLCFTLQQGISYQHTH